MVKTWEAGKAEDFTCECGAVYAVTVRRFPARDSDSADCSVCGQKMAEWNSTYSPSFSLIKNPTENL
jgi:hypothetical protein